MTLYIWYLKEGELGEQLSKKQYKNIAREILRGTIDINYR